MKKICCFCFLLSVLIIVFVGCGQVADSDGSSVGDVPPQTLHVQSSLKKFTSFEECMELADYVVACTVKEIGDTYLYGDATLPQNATPEEVNDYIRAIRTPIVLQIDEAYYDRSGKLGDTLTILDYRGTFDGYALTNDYPEYTLGNAYLLFIAQAPDGVSNLVIPQGSVALSSDAASNANMQSAAEPIFIPLMNDALFSDYSSVDAVAAEIRRIVAEA